MARSPKPWYWKARKAWFVTLAGTRHFLADDKKQAEAKFHQLMATPIRQKVRGDSLVLLFDLYLTWTKQHRSEATYGWYKRYLQLFIETIPANLIDANAALTIPHPNHCELTGLHQAIHERTADFELFPYFGDGQEHDFSPLAFAPKSNDSGSFTVPTLRDFLWIMSFSRSLSYPAAEVISAINAPISWQFSR